MKVVFRHMVDSLGLVPLLLVFLLILAAATALALWIFFKLPTKEGGVYGGLDSIKDLEEREAMRRYIFGLDEERPMVGKEKVKAEAKAAKAKAADETVDPAAAGELPVADVVDAEFEAAAEDVPEAMIAEEIGEVVEEVMEDAADSEETV